ncbi:DUF805 domain-containing protein [Holosporaceae bacterium 'Namur']|nr:DUF805 domain-containing protein [Holosporaceae bacterium 'Namur']
MTNITRKLNRLFERIIFFNIPSRINRIRYFARTGLNLLIVIVVFFSLIVGIHGLSIIFPGVMKEFINDNSYIILVVLGIPFCIGFINMIILRIKRLHDLNSKGWWVLLSFIPGVQVFFEPALFLIDGTKGDNKFGALPDKATKTEYIITGIPLFIIFIFILCVIGKDIYNRYIA